MRSFFKVSSLFFLVSLQYLEATTTRDVFAKHLNPYFIETGSAHGNGIQSALEAGFRQVYSIELSPHFFEYCTHRFASNPNVVIFQGDSSYVLPKILAEIDAPATFWLDGHYSGEPTAKGDSNTPVLAELEAIRQHPIKTHTVMIDDVRQFGTIHFDYITLEEIIQKIMEINANYQISYENGHVPNDVLIAEIRDR